MLQPPEDGPAILIYDIETAPGLAWVWGAYDQNVIAMEQDWYALSVAYKWLGSDELDFISIVDDPKFKPDTDDDYYVVSALHQLFELADVTVAHNGDRFDRRKSNARFLFHGFDPPSPYQTVDTRKEAAYNFANFSNGLQELGRLHGLGEKLPNTGFQLWRACMAGDPKAWATMEDYNRQDVLLLERLYRKLLPWINRHPNRALIQNEKDACPRCGASDGFIRNGIRHTSVSAFQAWKCRNCRGTVSSRLSSSTPETRPTRK